MTPDRRADIRVELSETLADVDVVDPDEELEPDETPRIGPEAPEADAAEQARVVELDEDDYR
jgi:hypothetical protein